MNIATIINYCSNEYQFIEESVKSVGRFSRQINVVMADHLFDGTKETEEDVQKATTAVHSAVPGSELIVFEYDHNITSAYGTRYWHNMCRWIGVSVLLPEIDYVLFLDADEIAEGEKFKTWIEEHENNLPQTIKFANYFYFRERKYQAKTYEDSIVMAANRENLRNQNVMFAMERDSIYESGLTKIRSIVDSNNLPMFHHYSWVRTREQMLRKVRCWGHNKDKNWEALVEEEFSRPFNGKDFVHGYEYNILN